MIPTSGTALPELVIAIGRQDLIRYAGAANDYLPQHWDQAMMREQGFEDVVVHGWLGCAHLVRAATAIMTPDRRTLVDYAVRYRTAIYPGEVRCGGDVVKADPWRCEIAGWIRDNSGTLLTTADLVFATRDGAVPG